MAGRRNRIIRTILGKIMEWLVPVEHRRDIVGDRIQNESIPRCLLNFAWAWPSLAASQVRRTFDWEFVGVQAFFLFVAALAGPRGPWFLLTAIVSAVLILKNAFMDPRGRTLGEPFIYGAVATASVIFCHRVFGMGTPSPLNAEFDRGAALSMVLISGWRLIYNAQLPLLDPRTPEQRYRAAVRLIMAWWGAAVFLSVPLADAVPGSPGRDTVIGGLFGLSMGCSLWLRQIGLSRPTTLEWLKLVRVEPQEISAKVNVLMRPVKRTCFLAALALEGVFFVCIWWLPGVAIGRWWSDSPLAAQTDWLTVWMHVGGLAAISLLWISVNRANRQTALFIVMEALK